MWIAVALDGAEHDPVLLRNEYEGLAGDLKRRLSKPRNPKILVQDSVLLLLQGVEDGDGRWAGLAALAEQLSRDGRIILRCGSDRS